MKRELTHGLAALFCTVLAGAAIAAEPDIAPSPFPMLRSRALTPPLLDAAPVCLPRAERGAFAEAGARARAGDIAGSRQKLTALVQSGELEARQDAALALAILDARGGADVRAARRELEAALSRSSEPAARACARLELARLALRGRLLPEAQAELGRVDRELGDAPQPAGLAETMQFYRAEVAMLAGRREVARRGYETLSTTPDARLGQAVRLRLADLAVDWPVPPAGAASAAGWRELRSQLSAARARGFDVAPWSVRAAEVAIAAAEYDEAHRWLADAERLEGRDGVASIRKADVLVVLGRGADARNILDRVATAASFTAARELANVRRAGYGLAGESSAQRVERLRRGAGSAHPHVSALARYELARVLLTAGDVEGTLEALTRLAYTGALPGAQDGLERTLDRAVAAAARGDVDCPTLVERLGGRRGLFISLGGKAGPFLRLGDCFLELGMPDQALDVYRQVARRFGASSATGLPLRTARASLASGDLPILRATLRAYFAQRRAEDENNPAAPDDPHWRWLRAQLDLHDGKHAVAGVALAKLARDPELPPETRVAVERALARLDPAAIPLRRLGVALASSLGKPTPGIESARRAEAWLRLADVQREQGRNEVARAAYRRAAELLPEGTRSTRARFAAAMLAPDMSATHSALAKTNAEDARTHWSALADAERRLIALRAAARGEVLGR